MSGRVVKIQLQELLVSVPDGVSGHLYVPAALYPEKEIPLTG
jgi:hypothetical protein